MHRRVGEGIDYLSFAKQVDKFPFIDAGNVELAMQIERMYTGELFGDKAYVWAIHETERYARMYASFSQKIAAALISLQDAAAASKLLIKLNERNPLDELVVRLLMTTREMIGDKKGLKTLYSDYVRLLGFELGIRPSEELSRFYESLLQGLAEGK